MERPQHEAAGEEHGGMANEQEDGDGGGGAHAGRGVLHHGAACADAGSSLVDPEVTRFCLNE